MIIKDAETLVKLGQQLGAKLRGGETIELIGDVGAGKTTFTRGIARGLGITAPITSPSFTIMNSYNAKDGITFNHYDFYRLDDPGIMRAEIAESSKDSKTITIIEWADSVEGILPKDKIIIKINYSPNDNAREVEIINKNNSHLGDI